MGKGWNFHELINTQVNPSLKIFQTRNFGLFHRQIVRPSFTSVISKKEISGSTTDTKIQGVCKIALRRINTDVKEGDQNHVMHWNAERILSLALLGTIPSAFVISNPVTEYLLAFLLTVHAHWGIEAIVCDYVRSSVFGNFIPKFAMALVYGLSSLTLGGLIYFIYTDVGIINAVKLLWKL
ncbi:UNVERIFIED_CONTAM: hypothetical protein RMT77_003793 [Armadillidium vulgare]